MSKVSKVTVGVSVGSGTVDFRIDAEGGIAFATLTMSPQYARSLAEELVAASERADANEAERVKSRRTEEAPVAPKAQ